ncbi:hypothetical protein NMG60_11008532 [Bertholletia excelsa]
MEKTSQLPLPGQCQLNLNKSFQLSTCSCLTTCSNEEISKAFGSFTKAKQEALHCLFLPIVDAVVVAKNLGATLVLPDITGSKPGDKR